ncbi:hypothetical protein D915_009893 [Fasciola hepatica]|uniref:Uncharacterized protein n=1 Tax=Fasciola hepatica TaxID=6192 RepID=A0A4E0QYN3_FASHE|nr:hypothetical protein D915_009893 [Fasciola hepatica]
MPITMLFWIKWPITPRIYFFNYSFFSKFRDRISLNHSVFLLYIDDRQMNLIFMYPVHECHLILRGVA